ncbi:MAG: hypothetical protein JW751_29015 [Polyangiaceae bacterium]|nr:hypothetical protein [Polyangiaceae bacterium]
MTAPLSISGRVLVLGEGRDEQRFFSWLLGATGCADVQVLEYGGKNNLGAFLKALPSVTGFSNVARLVVTRDADESAASAFQSACSGLRSAGLPVPTELGVLGGADAGPRVAVHILCGDEGLGALEDVVLRAVAGDPATACVDALVACLADRGALPVRHRLGKAKLQAWLASRERPGLQLGEAAQAGYLDATSAVFGDLVRLVRDGDAQ